MQRRHVLLGTIVGALGVLAVSVVPLASQASGMGTQATAPFLQGDSKTNCAYPSSSIATLETLSDLTGTTYNCVLLFDNQKPTWSDWVWPWWASPPSPDMAWDSWLQLTKLRTAAGLTEVALAKAVGFSNSKISRMEDSKVPIFIDDLETLLDFYRVSKARRTELLDVARHAQERNWLRINNPYLPHDWQVWEEFELEARALNYFELSVVPGPLQTPEYARAIITATGRGLPEAEVDGLVASRMSRQNLLTLSRPVRLQAIIDEHALERPFGDREVVAQQIQHLIRMVDRPNISVQLLPTDAGLHSGLNGPFVLMHYQDEASLVLLENKVASMFLDEDEQIETYEAVWGELSALAYDEVETLDFFRAMAAKIGG